MTRKNLIIACSLITGLFILGIVLTGWMVYRIISGRMMGYKPSEIPADLQEPRIVLGQDFFAREVFLKAGKTETITGILREIGGVEDLAVGELDGSPGLDVVIAGTYGAIIADLGGTKRLNKMYEFEYKFALFEFPTPQRMLGDIRIIDIEGDHNCEYFGRGSIDGTAVFAHDGKRLWSYGKYTKEKTSISDLATGDVDGDGILEFIAGWDKNIELFERSGKRRWARHSKFGYWQAEVVDVNGDKKNEIIYSRGNILTISDAQGNILKEVKMPIFLSKFALCTNPGTDNPHILAIEDGATWLIDFDGKVVARFDAPLSKVSVPPYKIPPLDHVIDSESVYQAEGALVKFSDRGPEHLAIIARFSVIDRSLLYIYSAEGKLVYQEVIPAECNAIAILPKEEGKPAQALLIGCERNVLRYDAR